MEKLGLDLDDSGVSSEGHQLQSAEDARRLSIQRCLQALVHSCQCRDANCRLQSCQKMNRILLHAKLCKHKNNDCRLCRQFVGLCGYHAKSCQEVRCLVPLCDRIRQKLQERQMLMRSGSASNHSGASGDSSQSLTTTHEAGQTLGLVNALQLTEREEEPEEDHLELMLKILK